MTGIQKFIVIVGRVFLSFIFLLAAIHKLIDWHGSEEALVQALNHAMIYYKDIHWLVDTVEFLIPWATIILVIALVFELIGGLFIFFGIKVRLGSILLMIFLIPATFFFHGFWSFTGTDHGLQMTMFLKNLSIFGGLILVFAQGSCKAKHASEESFTEIHTE